jgi:outer membrane protein OmpA-like peptidoglycan-associated protein
MTPGSFAAPVSRAGDDAEKSFWISFADLMTALMMLFLLVMTVALLSLTQSARSVQNHKQQRAEDIGQVMEQIARAAQQQGGLDVDLKRHVIDFGDRARFETGSHRLSDEAAQRLRAFVPALLAAADSEPGQRWLRRIVVEGFADPRGTYLMNMNLSLQRGQRVLCVLLDPAGGANGIGANERKRIRDLFSVGGFAFNAQRESFEASRRIELRVEFRDVGEPAAAKAGPGAAAAAGGQELGVCALDR